MVRQIMSVDKSKDGSRTYATDSKGNPMFGRTPAITDKLIAGAYVNVIDQRQTKTYDAEGKLVDLEPEEQRSLTIITAVFPDRQSAIANNAEEQLFDVETSAYVASQKHVIAEKYKVAGSLAGAV